VNNDAHQKRHIQTRTKTTNKHRNSLLLDTYLPKNTQSIQFEGTEKNILGKAVWCTGV